MYFTYSYAKNVGSVSFHGRNKFKCHYAQNETWIIDAKGALNIERTSLIHVFYFWANVSFSDNKLFRQYSKIERYHA